MMKLPAQKVDGLIDGMAVLQELASDPGPVSGLALAKKLNMSPVRVNRLLKTFAYLGYVYQTTARKYMVGPAIHVIAAQTMNASGLLRRAFGYLENLSKEVPTVALGMLWRNQVCYLFHKSGHMPMGEGIGGHSLYEASKSSLGVVLLAEFEDGKIMELYKDDDIGSLMNDIMVARAKGYALLKHGDHYSLAVKIGCPAYAALGVSGFKDEKLIAPTVERLLEYAEKIAKHQ